MRAAAEAAGKPLWAHANELAASAGYALASAADRIWVAETGEVGSIGVVAAHVDMSRADEKAGLKWTYIYEGDRKVDGNPHEPLSPEADSAIRADVSALYDMFVDMVAQHRAMSAQDVRDTEADTFRGALAVDSGLADEVGTLDEALEAFADHVDKMQTGSGPRAERQTKRQKMDPKASAPKATTETPATTEPATAPAPAAPAPAPASPEPAPDAAQAAVTAERTRCAALFGLSAQATQLGVEFDAAKAVSDNVSLNAARERILTAAADKDRAAETTTVATAPQGKEAKAAEGRSAWGRAFKRSK